MAKIYVFLGFNNTPDISQMLDGVLRNTIEDHLLDQVPGGELEVQKAAPTIIVGITIPGAMDEAQRTRIEDDIEETLAPYLPEGVLCQIEIIETGSVPVS